MDSAVEAVDVLMTFDMSVLLVDMSHGDVVLTFDTSELTDEVAIDTVVCGLRIALRLVFLSFDLVSDSVASAADADILAGYRNQMSD